MHLTGHDEPTPPMPAHASVNTLLARVLHDHDVTLSELAGWLGCHRGAVSRMVNGQQSVTACALIELYRRTGDTRLVQAIAGPDSFVTIDLDHPDLTGRPEVDLAALMVALAGVQQQSLKAEPFGKSEQQRTVSSIDTAIAHLLRVRRRAAAGERVPFQHRRASGGVPTLSA